MGPEPEIERVPESSRLHWIPSPHSPEDDASDWDANAATIMAAKITSRTAAFKKERREPAMDLWNMKPHRCGR